jgi:hypothetical protein
LKLIQQAEVFRDRVTGVCYTEALALYRVAVIDGPGKVSTRGTLLTPFGGHPDVDWDDPDKTLTRSDQVAQHGFVPNNWGQDVLVTDEQLASRFENLGMLSREVDFEAAVAHYESECCDFSNRQALIASTIRQLQNRTPALQACELYTLLKDYQKHTPITEV